MSTATKIIVVTALFHAVSMLLYTSVNVWNIVDRGQYTQRLTEVTAELKRLNGAE